MFHSCLPLARPKRPPIVPTFPDADSCRVEANRLVMRTMAASDEMSPSPSLWVDSQNPGLHSMPGTRKLQHQKQLQWGQASRVEF